MGKAALLLSVINEEKGATHGECGSQQLGTISASCSNVQRSLTPVACFKDDISLC